MFILLHRVAKGLLIGACIAAVGAITWQIYEHRSVFEPVLGAYRTGTIDPNDQPQPVTVITGIVVRVESGSTFALRQPGGREQRFSLTGITTPHFNLRASKKNNDLALLCTTNLNSLILSNQVVVNACFIDRTGGGHGIVHLNGTNLNALLVERGYAHVRPVYLKCLSFKDRYVLLRAQQKAQPIPSEVAATRPVTGR